MEYPDLSSPVKFTISHHLVNMLHLFFMPEQTASHVLTLNSFARSFSLTYQYYFALLLCPFHNLLFNLYLICLTNVGPQLWSLQHIFSYVLPTRNKNPPTDLYLLFISCYSLRPSYTAQVFSLLFLDKESYSPILWNSPKTREVVKVKPLHHLSHQLFILRSSDVVHQTQRCVSSEVQYAAPGIP